MEPKQVKSSLKSDTQSCGVGLQWN